jgi:uncharacterized coiled-coil DUF342 family protein
MTDFPPADTPLAIDRVESAPGDGDGVRLRLTGRWLGAGDPDEHEALLVVQLQGRRHRFPAIRDQGDAPLPPGAWIASFTLPAWAEPHQHGQAALWLGNAVIPVPPPGASGVRAALAVGATPAPKAASPVEVAVPPRSASTPSRVAAADVWPEHPSESGRPGPLADLLFKETVAALHSELEQRSADVARLRGALADAQSELEARAATQAGLEAAHGELRGELQELIAAVARQRAELDESRTEAQARGAAVQQQLSEATAARHEHADEAAALRQQLAAASVSRDAAISEVAGLRSELDRLGTELAVAREQLGAEGGDLREAQRLLADARALSDQLRGRAG